MIKQTEGVTISSPAIERLREVLRAHDIDPPSDLDGLLNAAADAIIAPIIGVSEPHADIDADDQQTTAIELSEFEQKIIARAKELYSVFPTYRGVTALTWNDIPPIVRMEWITKARKQLTAPVSLERMSLHSRPGDIVVFDGQGGYDHEVSEAKAFLELGKCYEVESISIGSWSSVVWVKGFNTGFNTVLFGQPAPSE